MSSETTVRKTKKKEGKNEEKEGGKREGEGRKVFCIYTEKYYSIYQN